MKVHEFTSSSEAYDATQCDEWISDGDIVIIRNEGVAGIAHTWPFAITENCGCLHKIAPDQEGKNFASKYQKSINECVRIAKENNWNRQDQF